MYDDVLGLTENDIKKYAPLIDADVEVLKEKLQNLCYDYYNSYLNNDAKLFNETKAELQKYLDFNANEVTDYINYCFIQVIHKILHSLYNFDVNLLEPANPGLSLKRHLHKEADYYIKKEGLTQKEVEQIIEYNKQSADIDGLCQLGVFNVKDKPKPNINLSDKLANTMIRSIYVGENEKDNIEVIIKWLLPYDIFICKNENENAFKEWFFNDYLKTNR